MANKIILVLTVVATFVAFMYLHNMIKNNRDRAKIGFITVILVICAWFTGSLLFSSVRPASTGPVFITAAHIPPEEFPNMELLYVDEKQDKAYYLDKSYDVHTYSNNSAVNIGDNLLGKITDSEDSFFYVKLENPEAVERGLSGERVYYKDVAIGYVSALTEDSLIKCVYF